MKDDYCNDCFLSVLSNWNQPYCLIVIDDAFKSTIAVTRIHEKGKLEIFIHTDYPPTLSISVSVSTMSSPTMTSSSAMTPT